MTILLAAILMGAIGLLFAFILAVADKRFKVEIDPRISAVESVLPGVNCGGCGFPSCAMYANGVAVEGAAADLCVVGGEATAREVAHIMGVRISDELKEKLVAVVFCQGDSEASSFPGQYRGIADCAAAVYSQDVAKRCKYGCVGLGSCVAACPFDAIHLSATGIPFVDAVKCTGCGKCVAACPRNLIELHPVSEKTFVYCKSQDPNVIARKICKKACIACGICVKAAEKDGNGEAVAMVGNLAVVNTKNYTAKSEYGVKCPTDSYADDRNSVNRERELEKLAERREAVQQGSGENR
ncbi:MAG TPA: RnfABCDGE type electron transport complex subunit B [Spirochaetia bacterium]|nr:RnfABCDGE type electron transport complex subunit B [Spirochaetia bacterium]